MRLTFLEIDVILGMLGDVDPAHHEDPSDRVGEVRRREAADRAYEKLLKRYWELKEK